MTDAVEHWDHYAERALIGCALLDETAVDLVRVSPMAFTLGAARIAWRTMLELREAGKPIDPLTVADCAVVAPAAKSELPTFLSGCLCETITSANVEHYAEIVKRHHVTRLAREVAADIIAQSDRGVVGKDLLSFALEHYAGLDQGQDATAETISALVRNRYEQITRVQDAHAAGETVLTGFPSGVHALDQVLGGLQPGIVTLVAGRPGMGKSAFGLTVADVNSGQGIGVHVFSLEDVRAAYCDRIISRHSEIAADRIRGGEPLQREEMGAVRDAANHLARRAHWLVDDRSGIDAREIVRSVRRARRDNGTRVAIVDYIQLLKRQSGQNAHEAITESINVLADAAKQDDMAYVVMSQLSRKIEGREDKRPGLADLRESGSLEERAKAVIGLFRPYVYDVSADKKLIEVHVLKNSQGKTGYADATWNGPTTNIY